MADKETKKEIDEMLTALGNDLPKEGDGDGEETPDEKAAREAEEAEEAEAKRKEEEEAAAAEGNDREHEGETEEEKKAREAKEAEEAFKGGKTDEDKEKEALETIRKEKEERERAEEEEKERLAKEEEEKKNRDKQLDLEDQDFIGDLDMDELTSDKAAFNKLLNAVYKKGVNDSKKIATESVLTTVPDIVKHNVQLLTELKKDSDKFYDDNKDLAPFKKVVAAVFEEIAAKNPDKKRGELMNLVAPEARKRLGLKEQAAKKEEESKGDKGGSPRLHGAKGGQRPTPAKQNISSMESEISEMNKTLGR